ncbi:unnamed protein product [Peronospora belbahrii]|nr:unnamed protein product [Peronospora belbahrii]
MSHHVLTRFYQQQQQQQEEEKEKKRWVMYQHVAAKFNGVEIADSLGTIGVTSIDDDSGIIWLQTMQSDSNALERHEKSKLTGALFFTIEKVLDVVPIAVQNKFEGVEIQLMHGNQLELTFMPGSFAHETHRDTFLETLKKHMSDTALDEAKVTTTSARQKKQELRRLVRRYTKLDDKSQEGLEIAKQVYADTGYYLGPMTKANPKFAADAEYRRKSMEDLTCFLHRMNQEWSDADSQRETHTKAKHFCNKKGLFKYTDTVTGVQIPSRTYEERYLKYVKAHEVNPVLHLFPSQEKATQGDKIAENGLPAPLAVLEPDEGAKLFLTATFGINIVPSCIIGKDFFSSGAKHVLSDIQRYRNEDMAFRAAVDSCRENVWHRWGTTFDLVSGKRAIQAGQGDFADQSQPKTGIAGKRKRARERRQSLVLPTTDDLQSTIEASVANNSEDANDATLSRSEPRQTQLKSSRFTPHRSDTAQKSRRKYRRQSTTHQVNLASVATNMAENKTIAENCRVARSSRKSPQSRYSANGYVRETSSLEMVEDEDSDMC